MMNCTRPRAQGSAEGDYFICVEGLPTNYTWGMLKDLVRRIVPHPGWTEMGPDPQGTQKRRGWVKIKQATDAHNLFDLFANRLPFAFGTDLRVCLWCTFKAPPEMLMSNCVGPIQAPTPPHQQAARVYTTTPPPLRLPPPRLPLSPALSTASVSRLVASREISTNPTDIHANNTIPIDVTSGPVKTDSRAIFISRLDLFINHKMLEAYLGKFEAFEECEIQKNRLTGRSRGFAIAKFATREAAATVVRELDGRKVMGKAVKVRMDMRTEAVVSKAVKVRMDTRTEAVASKADRDGPVIANGSNEWWKSLRCFDIDISLV